jgi:bacterioferritin
MSSPTPAQPDRPASPQMTDVTTLRERARRTLDDGAVTPSYALDTETVVKLLNEALATEIVCTLRYRRHYFCAEGIHSESIKQEFLEHANQELAHADRIAERIVQLGGEPDLSPQTLTQRSHAEYVEGKTLRDMIRENLIAERIAIESYREMIQFVGEHDPTTRRMLETVLADEEEHADDMSSLLKQMGS